MAYSTKIKVDLFISAMMLFISLSVIAYFIVFAKSEGNFAQNRVLSFTADYILYVFPLAALKISANFPLLYGLTCINILIYAVSAVVLFTRKLEESKRYKPFDLIHISAYVIPSLFIIIFILGQFKI